MKNFMIEHKRIMSKFIGKHKEFIREFIGKQKNCFITMLALIAVCEMLLKINNVYIQSVGVLLLPIIVFLGINIMKNSKINA